MRLKFIFFWSLLTLFCITANKTFAVTASSVTQYGITWTFDGQYECGQFVTGDWWVVGPVVITSVSPNPTSNRNGSCVNPMGNRQGYDDRIGFNPVDRVSFPYTLQPNQSLVSSVSKPEGAETKNVGCLQSQAVLTSVSAPQPAGTFRPGYAGTYKMYFNESEINYGFLPNLPLPSSAPSNADDYISYTDMPRIDHIGNSQIQHGCAQDNFTNGHGYPCYGRDYTELVSNAMMYAMIESPQRAELVNNIIQMGIDNYSVIRAGGDYSGDGGHYSGRKAPIVFAAKLLGDADMSQVGDYPAAPKGQGYFAENDQTYYGVSKALFGIEAYNDFCVSTGAKDQRDPNGLLDGCGYRALNGPTWPGEMLAILMIDAKSIWNHDAFFDYVDRWMNGDVGDGGTTSATFVTDMWNMYRDNLPSGGGSTSVATPSISPASGTFTEPVTVTITCATSGAEIRYTTNGSDPTQSSTLYSGSFVVSSTTTVKARGYKTDLDASSVASSTITISDPVAVTSVSVSPTSLSLEAGQSSDLTETVSPANATDKSVTWTSSNTSKATVDANGIVTAIAEGNATITVTTTDGGYTATCNVTVSASAGGLPSPWVNTDIGAVAAAGSASFLNGTFTVEGSGSNIWSTADEFHFVYQQISGDATITARISSLTHVHDWTKGGVMMREDLTSGSINGHTFLAPIASNGSKFSYRTTAGATSSEFDGPDITAPYWLRMERSGNSFTGSVSVDGTTWTTLGSQTINMSSTYYVGLCVSSLDDGTLATGTFDNVSVTTTSTVPVTGVSVSPTSLTLDEGQTSDLTETVSPINATDKSVTWSSNNTSVATVDANGLVTAIGEGNATITVTTVDGSFTATCDVTVNIPVIPVTDVSISASTLTLDEGQTADLDETVSPANATDQSVTWGSSNASIATVNTSGLVTAVSAGSATITVTTTDGGFTAACSVTVNASAGSSNLALGKAVSVSAYQDDSYGVYPGSNLVDDDVSDAARWSADGFPQWAEIDLGQNSDLSSIELYTYQSRAYQYIVEAKADGGSYSTIVDRSSNTNGTQPITDAVSTTARYVKITVSGASGYAGTWVSLTELKVIGSAGSSTIPVTGVSVSPTSLNLEEGQTSDLTETVSPANATEQSVTWSSSNASVATVNSSGLVTAISAGSATITVTTVDGGFTANCAVTVTTAIVPVTGVSVSPTLLNLEEGQTSDLTETVSPANATNQSVTWSSNNTSVATVNSSGLVTAVSAGSATITVTTVDGGFTANCAVTVTTAIIPVTGVSVSPTSLSLEVGQSSDLTETVSPANATEQSVTWSSSNTSVATVNSNGLVTAVSAGNATITVTTVDGGYAANCAVTVTSPSLTWTELTYDDFEGGFGNFKDGGGDCYLYTSGTYAHQGSNAGQIQDNQDVYSSFYYVNSIDLSSYKQLKIEFWFYGLGMNDGHDFFVEYSDDGGSSWQSIAQYIQGSGNDFVNGQFYEVAESGDFAAVVIDDGTYNFSSNVKIRFRCDGLQNDDQVYIDEVKVSATTSAGSSANITLAEQNLRNGEAVISIYPNPLSGSVLNIQLNGYNNDEVNVAIYDMMGRAVYRQVYSVIDQTELQAPSSNLNKGVYIISVNGKQQKLIVE